MFRIVSNKGRGVGEVREVGGEPQKSREEGIKEERMIIGGRSCKDLKETEVCKKAIGSLAELGEREAQGLSKQLQMQQQQLPLGLSAHRLNI